MELGDKKAKYAIQVGTKSYASKHVGVIYCNTEEEYNKLLDDNFDQIMDDGHFSINVSNDFDLSDVDIEEIKFDEDKQYYLNK